MSTEFPASFEDQRPARREPNWWLITAVLAGVIGLCVVGCCVGTVAIAPKYGAGLATSLCRSEYPELSDAECSAWGDEIFTEHPDEFRDCQNYANESSRPQREALFECLDERDLGPTTYK